MKKTQATKNGFTLVETMVAISILMLAILGPLSIASAGLRNSLFARDQIVAFYLAQEGIEYIRYARDDNFMKNAQTPSDPKGWLNGLDDCIIDGDIDYEQQEGCIIDTYKWSLEENPKVEDHIDACSDENCSNHMIYQTPQGNYTYDPTAVPNSKPSRYYRSIKIQPMPGNAMNQSVKVISTVTWSGGTQGARSYTLTEYLYNIYTP